MNAVCLQLLENKRYLNQKNNKKRDNFDVNKNCCFNRKLKIDSQFQVFFEILMYTFGDLVVTSNENH